MAFNVQEFKSSFNRQSFAKQNNFDVLFTLPLGLIEDSRSLSLRCETIEFPGRAMTAIDTYRGRGYDISVNVPYGGIHMELGATFICSEDLREKEIFEEWQDKIIGNYRQGNNITQRTQFNPGYYDDWIKPCSMEIRQYNEAGDKTYEVQLIEIFPRTINPLSSSWASNEFHKLQVLFNYRYYRQKRNRNPFNDLLT